MTHDDAVWLCNLIFMRGSVPCDEDKRLTRMLVEVPHDDYSMADFLRALADALEQDGAK